MKNIRTFVLNVFQLNQQDFWLIVFCNIFLGICFTFISVHAFIQAAFIFLMLFKSFGFLKVSSVMPAISSDFDRFSWKYLQGLPLSKRELVITLVLSNFLSTIPLLIWVLSFHSQIGNIFTDETMEYSTKLKLLVISLPFLVASGFHSLKNIIKLPRNQYSRVDHRIKAYEVVKSLLILSVVITYGSFLLSFINDLFDFQLAYYAKIIVKSIYETLTSWWIIPLSLLCAFHMYHSTLKTWQIEKSGYIKQNWKTKRDVPIMATCLAMQVFFFQQLDLFTPSIYLGSPILKSIHKGNIEEVSKALKKGVNLNAENKYGVTPLMAAAKEGHLDLFMILKNHGAKQSGEVKHDKSYYLDGMKLIHLATESRNYKLLRYLLKGGLNVNEKNSKNHYTPLHIAALKCDTSLIDLLLYNKADINDITKKGNTALHIASKNGCFSVVVALLEAGAKIKTKNKEGKAPIDLAESSRRKNKDVIYYLKKWGRSPASQK